MNIFPKNEVSLDKIIIFQRPQLASHMMLWRQDSGSRSFGKTITDNRAASGSYPLFQWCNSLNGPNTNNIGVNGTGIGGFNDWYIPSKDELAIVYFNLKPNTEANSPSSGSNPVSVDPYTPNTNYGSEFPNQVIDSNFQTPGVGTNQAFDNGGVAYWTATETSGGFSDTQQFNNGQQSNEKKDGTPTGTGLYARAIRRERA